MSFVAAAIAGAAVVGAGASIYGASKAAGAAKDAAGSANQLSADQYAQTRRDLAPYRQAGTSALRALQMATDPAYAGKTSMEVPLSQEEIDAQMRAKYSEWLQGDAQSGPIKNTPEAWAAFQRDFEQGRLGSIKGTRTVDTGTAQNAFVASPGYQFRLDQGNKAIASGAAARGRLFSGDALKKTAAFSQGTASQEWDNYLANLRYLSGVGQASATQTAALGANAANTQGANTMAAGGQRASSYLTAAEGVNNAVQGGLGNYLLADYLKTKPVGG